MGTLRPVLESIFPVFHGGIILPLYLEVRQHMVFQVIFFIPGYTGEKNKKNRMMPDLDAVS